MELRLQIWEAACLPSTSSCPGLHYINVKLGKAVIWDLDSTGRPNRSAYMIDGGLWRAVKESREVITKRCLLDD
jgi:hypothetical protein